MDRNLRTVDDLLRLLDELFAPEADRWTADAGSSWWDNFYTDRSKRVPFFVAKPDENLVSYLDRGLITPGRALDLGCGPGRNALRLASAGFTVDAVDLSPAASSPSPAPRRRADGRGPGARDRDDRRPGPGRHACRWPGVEHVPVLHWRLVRMAEHFGRGEQL